MQHTFNVPQAIQDVEEFVENVKTMSEGKISFRLYRPNALVPNSELWEAVADEQLDVAISAPILSQSSKYGYFPKVHIPTNGKFNLPLS